MECGQLERGFQEFFKSKMKYYCTGGCKGEADVSGVCQTSSCPKHGKPLTKTYKCEECGMHYLDESIAQKCEAWCKKYKSCNIEYIKEALESK